MQKTSKTFEQNKASLREHDLNMINWCYRFLAYEQEYQEFCTLQEIHRDRIAFWGRVLSQLQESHDELQEQAQRLGW